MTVPASPSPTLSIFPTQPYVPHAWRREDFEKTTLQLGASEHRMDLGERADLIQQLCLDVDQLARAGIRAQWPDYSEIEICHELARRRYGAALADAAYAGILRPG